MYSFSPKLKLVSIILLVVELVLFTAGYFMNHGIDDTRIEHMMEAAMSSGEKAPTHSSEVMTPAKDHDGHLAHAKHQIHNQPLASIHFIAVFFFGVTYAATFFYCIQHITHPDGPIIITKVMEVIEG